MEFKLDRTAFKWHSVEVSEKSKLMKDKTYGERLQIACYLIEQAFGLKDFKSHKVDRTQFKTRKHS